MNATSAYILDNVRISNINYNEVLFAIFSLIINKTERR